MAPVGTLAVGLAFLLDAAVGEPPRSIHPVAKLGQIIAVLDRPVAYPRAAGIVLAVVLPVLTALVAAVPVWLLEGVNQWIAAGLAGLILFTMVSHRMLTSLATTVIDASESDPETAKRDIIGLVGRDTDSLGPGELRSAAVESLAENLADGLVGPLLAFGLGSLLSLPVAVGAAVWVKAVNTLDSMLGYPDRPFGTGSARLDDLVEWVPARLSAGLIALAAGSPGTLSQAREWATAPPSPNSGWPMAVMAATVESRLVKPGVYDLNPTASLPDGPTATRAVRVGRRAGLLAFALAGVIAWF